MTLREILESGIVIEGLVKIQSWKTDNTPTVHFEDTEIGNIPEVCMDREVTYIFPYAYRYTKSHTPGAVDPGFEAGICIEIEKEEGETS